MTTSISLHCYFDSSFGPTCASVYAISIDGAFYAPTFTVKGVTYERMPSKSDAGQHSDGKFYQHISYCAQDVALRKSWHDRDMIDLGWDHWTP